MVSSARPVTPVHLYDLSSNLFEAPPLLERMYNLCKWILITGIRIFYYLAHPTLFSLGFFVGIIWNNQIQNAIDKVIMVWKNQSWFRTILFAGFACLSLPTTFIVSSLLLGASTGCDVYEDALYR